MNREVQSAPLKIRSITVNTPVALAPMVGLSHSAIRSLLVEQGGVGLLFTEMMAAKRLPHDSVNHSPMLVRSAIESPLIYQIFLATEEPVQLAVEKLETIGADGVDVNLGCPAPQLRRRGAGGFLAEDGKTVQRIFGALRRATELPVSAKIRLGRELDRNKLIDFCKMLEGEGIDFITVHGRLHGEKFCRPPRWDWIGYVKKELSIPVIANGGIFTVSDAGRCLEQSGADGLMIGRGGMERPWLFADIAREIYGRTDISGFATRQELFFRFIDLLNDRFAVERRLGRMKQFTQYYARAFTFGHHLASAVQNSNSMDEAVESAEQFFARTDPSELQN
ncbi:tRNA dihydrouridine synthase [Desulfosediminicola sp.]|uniref:tRNA dihydrouridine synthase n=1 Tax=Desulfosediminicola sp. TaxID=2886825 RepID=UPI003AF21A10